MSRGRGKSAPFSIRLGRQDDDYVQSEAKRLNRPRGAVVQDYTSEAIRMRRFPGVAFRGEDDDVLQYLPLDLDDLQPHL